MIGGDGGRTSGLRSARCRGEDLSGCRRGGACAPSVAKLQVCTSETADFEEIKKMILERDYNDMHSAQPLKGRQMRFLWIRQAWALMLCCRLFWILLRKGERKMKDTEKKSWVYYVAIFLVKIWYAIMFKVEIIGKEKYSRNRQRCDLQQPLQQL